MTIKTTKIQGGKEYALVPDRLKAFREEHPRAKIETEPTINGDTLIFKATIIVDKADPNSAEATGHSYGTLGKAKEFEKLETVATGRALSLLGYLNDGQVASTEEMQEFEEYRHQKYKEQIDSAKTVEELKTIFVSMSGNEQLEYTDLLSARRKEIEASQEGEDAK